MTSACDGGSSPGDAAVDGGRCTSDSVCDDGLFCNGAERCDPSAQAADARGCVAGGSPCGERMYCDESTDECVVDTCENPDEDGDGQWRIACGGDDCDDTDPTRYLGALEVCDSLGHDEDCDPTTLGPDADGDLYPSVACCNEQRDGSILCGGDCNDLANSINPGAVESCNGVDDDCDGRIDEGVQLRFYRDVDGDGYGVADDTIDACTAPVGYAVHAGDCDDTTRAINPAATEVCDTFDVDEDCDPTTVGSTDVDRDTHIDARCCNVAADGTRTCGTDCNDQDETVYPGAPELCDGIDNDCSEGGGASSTEDLDGDGTYAEGTCVGTGPWDCDDTRADLAPGRPDYVDMYCGTRIDDDCDGRVDEDGQPSGGGGCGTRPPVPPPCPVQRACDADGDGICAPPEGTDCDDDDPSRSPAWDEACDGRDDDCDGIIDEGACPEGCSVTERGGRLYLYCDAAVDFDTAQAACRAMGRQTGACGRHLDGDVAMSMVAFESAAEGAWISTTAASLGFVTPYWIGASEGPAGTWRWTSTGQVFWTGGASGSAPPNHYANWAPGQPSDSSGTESCGQVGSAGMWSDVSCATSRRYVCEGYRICAGGCFAPIAATWSTTAAEHRCRVGEVFRYSCPPAGSARPVAGDTYYTDDSSVCTAAVHAGVITFAAGGEVRITMSPARTSYTGSTRHGVTSGGRSGWSCSFTVQPL